MEIATELRQKAEELQSITLAENHLKHLDRTLETAHLELEKIAAIVDKEFEDIRSLEKLSINSLFRTILGNKEQQLEIERQAYLQALLKYKDLKKAIQLLEFEKQVLQEKIKDKVSLTFDVERLMRAREQEILVKNEDVVEQVRALNRELDELFSMHREIYEAERVGYRCQGITEELLELLKKATELRNWKSEERHQAHHYQEEKTLVDQAVDKYYQLKVDLLKFEAELRDVFQDQLFRFGTTLDQFQNFSETYYDHLINDWVIKKRIAGTVSLIENLKDTLARLLQSLVNEEGKVKKRADVLEEEKRMLLLRDKSTKRTFSDATFPSYTELCLHFHFITKKLSCPKEFGGKHSASLS